MRDPTTGGLYSLARTIRDLQIDDPLHLELDYSASSVCSLTWDLLWQLYNAARGLDPVADEAQGALETRVRVYYPSARSVHASEGGVAAGSHFFLKKRNWDSPSFPRACLRQHQPRTLGLLAHEKLVYARGQRANGSCFAWLYVGSANATTAAWGRISRGSVCINNHECGVILPVPAEDLCFETGSAIPSMASFDSLLPLPFVFPGDRFEGQDVPWMFA